MGRPKDEQSLEELAERRKEERENPPPEPEPFDPRLPGGSMWPPTFAALLDIDP